LYTRLSGTYELISNDCIICDFIYAEDEQIENKNSKRFNDTLALTVEKVNTSWWSYSLGLLHPSKPFQVQRYPNKNNI
jgi:hypothetical protein